MRVTRIRQAVFLVGGKGTRLGEITKHTPKPLLEIAPGFRFLDLLIEEASRQGFEEILLLAGHQGEQVEELYQSRNVLNSRIRVVRERSPQGTGGALAFAKDQLDPTFLVSNGDSFFDINLRSLARPLTETISARMALRLVDDPSRFGAVELEGGNVCAFQEKNEALRGPALINGGIYVMRREVVERIQAPCSIERDVFPALVESGSLEGEEHSGFFLDIGLPDTYEYARNSLPQRRYRKCAFLDRDGVLNEDDGYTHRAEDLIWKPGAREAVKLLNDAGFFVIVVSNQAGIARGYYNVADVEEFHKEMQNQLAEIGAYIDKFFICPYHKDGVIAEYTVENHSDRKPNPGMILKAAEQMPIDMPESFIIGDKESDLKAGEAAGIQGYLYDQGALDDLVRSVISGISAVSSPRK